MQFGDYNIWYENWSNYISSRRGINGRAGWVGNFALHDTGKVPIGIEFNGASSVQWGRQYNKSLWLAATPITPKWMPAGYEPYMSTIQSGSGIESSLSYKSTSADYGQNGGEKFYTINHSTLTSGNVFAGLDTSLPVLGDVNGGTGAYDTLQYRWSPQSTKLDFSLLNATQDTSAGTVSGGNSARVNEGLTIDNVFHYKPVKHFETCNMAMSSGITASGTTISKASGTTNFEQFVAAGDQVYRNSTGTPVWVGTVKSVNNNDQLTLVSTAAVTFTNDTTWSIISPRVKRSVGSPDYATGDHHNAPKLDYVMSGGALQSGVSVATGFTNTGYNVIDSNRFGAKNYNFRFGIAKRTYNQTPLLNTKGELTVVKTPDDAAKVIKPAMGDLSKYLPANFNIQVTRLNPKTHVERSISIVGTQANI